RGRVSWRGHWLDLGSVCSRRTNTSGGRASGCCSLLGLSSCSGPFAAQFGGAGFAVGGDASAACRLEVGPAASAGGGASGVAGELLAACCVEGCLSCEPG